MRIFETVYFSSHALSLILYPCLLPVVSMYVRLSSLLIVCTYPSMYIHLGGGLHTKIIFIRLHCLCQHNIEEDQHMRSVQKSERTF